MSTTLKDGPGVASETLAEAVAALQGGENCELPVLPEVAAQLLRLIADVDCDIADVVPLIKRDQSLTSHLLRVSNTLRYNTGVAVSSVQQAVARLGLLALREIVILISCSSKVFNVPEFDSDVRQSFRFSLATAAFSQEIARMRRINVEEAFLAGLLHDVGRPILLQAFADRRRSHGLCASNADILFAAGQQRIELAARLIQEWELSDRVAETVRFQDTPLESPLCLMQAATLRLARDLAGAALCPAAGAAGTGVPADVAPEAPEPGTSGPPHPMLEVLNLYPEQFEQLQSNSRQILEWVDSAL